MIDVKGNYDIFFMQFSLNKKISDKTSQNKDLSQCDIAISQYHNVSKTYIAALAHIAFADRQKHLTIAFARCPFREIATALQATSRNDIKCVARKTTKHSVRRVPIPNIEIIIVED